MQACYALALTRTEVTCLLCKQGNSNYELIVSTAIMPQQYNNLGVVGENQVPLPFENSCLIRLCHPLLPCQMD